jgi:hypothetical protein
MDTQVRTPQLVFMQPQRLVVPLFQRPYVWSQDKQWDPLWSDVTRMADRVLSDPSGKHHPHFLGAVVVQQMQTATGALQERTIIDGQQRLTTVQLLLDALHIELEAAGVKKAAERLETLVVNAESFCAHPEDRFKVWPTNRDRASFNAVMAAEHPIKYEKLEHATDRLVQAHRFFATRAKEWLNAEGPEQVESRGLALETSARELLQMVVIDLSADENAQEIFETLNARGAQLTAADLIKNFVFQRLMEAGVDVDATYEAHWKEFETGFWETEINYGRMRYPRSSAFLNQWLIAQTGEEIVAREVFTRFKHYADFESGTKMIDLLPKIHAAAQVYKRITMGAATLTGPVDRLSLFAYRTSVLESEAIKPLLLFLLDPEGPALPEEELNATLEVVESWLVRRMFVRATTKGYSQIIPELIKKLRAYGGTDVASWVREYFRTSTTDRAYWPDDDEVRQELAQLQIYRRLRRGRLRMTLEAIEDHLRGWRGDAIGKGEERVARGKLAIEHIMPRKWHTHWAQEGIDEGERDQIIHRLGNLTLLTGKMNASISNGKWEGENGKSAALNAHSVLFLNRPLARAGEQAWDEEAIGRRTAQLAETILEIWPVPEGHRSGFTRERQPSKRQIGLAELIDQGLLSPGATLYARRKRVADRTATVLPDGRIDVDGITFDAPSPAAVSITQKPTNGWTFFLVDRESRKSLKDLWKEYVETLDIDVDDDEDLEDVEDAE